jgi:hypothetical protein
MPQVFSRRLTLIVKLVLVGLAGALVALLASGGVWREHSVQALGEPVVQPIPFSHKHHVGDDGIDCRYCHTTVETGRHAGLPSTHTCLTCHSQLYRDAPLLQPLHESARTGTPIAWQRVHDLPDFVFFDHSVHVAKGVGCVECHGRIDQMPLTWRAEPLQMQWCLDCHRDPAPHLHPKSEVFSMAAPADGAVTARLVEAAHLQGTRRLTDCSTCHR